MSNAKTIRSLLEEASAVIGNALDYGSIAGLEAAHADALLQDIDAALAETEEKKPVDLRNEGPQELLAKVQALLDAYTEAHPGVEVEGFVKFKANEAGDVE